MYENRPPPPPPHSGQVKGLFNPCFPGLTLRYRNAVTWTCDQLLWFPFIYIFTDDDTTPSAISRLEHRVSVFFLWPFALLRFQSELPKALCSFVNCHESSPLFGLWPSRLAASIVVHWGGNRTVPWPLVWDSWPPLSYALLDQPPPPDHRKNHLIWVDSITVIPLAWSRMSLECLVGPRKFPTILMILSLQ